MRAVLFRGQSRSGDRGVQSRAAVTTAAADAMAVRSAMAMIALASIPVVVFRVCMIQHPSSSTSSPVT
jgi:hypothetical protein